MAEEAELIGGRVRELRIERGMKQRELAEALPGRTESKDISRWENGHHRPSSDTLSAIAKALGTDVGDLLCGPMAERKKREPTPDPFASSSELRELQEALSALDGKMDRMLGQMAALSGEVGKMQRVLQAQRGSKRQGARRSGSEDK